MFRVAHSGRLLNHLARASRAPTFAVGVADPDFPIARAYDHRTGSASMFLGNVANSAIIADKDVLANGDFENDPLDGWTVASGTLSRETGIVYAGSASGELESGVAFQDRPAVPGESWAGMWALRAGESGSAVLRVRCLETGRYLSPDRSWSPTSVDLANHSDSSWIALTTPFAFQVEPYSVCRSPEVTLRFEISAAISYFDSLAFWPLTDFVGIFGYNNAKGGLLLKAKDAGASGYERLFTRDQGAAVQWVYLGEMKQFRTFKFEWVGTPLTPIGFGELVLTQTTKIARANVATGVAPRPDFEIESRFAQEREEVPSGALHVSANGPGAVRTARMSFMLGSEEELSRLRDEIFGFTLGGTYPSILIGPSVVGNEACMFGRFEDRMPQTFPGGSDDVITRVEVGFLEDAFPRFGGV